MAEVVPLGETTVRTFLILLLHVRVQAQANLFAHNFLRKNGTGIVTNMGSFLAYEENPSYLPLLLRYGGKPKYLLALIVQGENPKHILALIVYGETRSTVSRY
jgi:hypothetical protein